MKWKYVIVTSMGIESPIIFPEWMDHNRVASEHNAISAGYVNISTGEWVKTEYGGYNDFDVSCHGHSVTLKVKAREEDAEIIKRMLVSGMNS